MMSTATPLPEPGEERLDRLHGAVAVLGDVHIDALDEPALHRELAALEDARRRLVARQCRLADALRARQAARLRATGSDAVAANRKAARQTQRELSDRLRWNPGEAKQATEVGRQLGQSPAARTAFDRGALPPRHARLLAETLAPLSGEVRQQAERQLLGDAARQDATTFGNTCRRLLARLDHDAAMDAQQRRHALRRATVAATDDGMTAITGQWAGLDGETLAAAVHAYRRPDSPDEHRSTEQATADAIVELARAALRAPDAPTPRGAPPQVIVTIDHEATLEQAGVAQPTHTGPLPFGDIRRLLADAGVCRLLTDPDGVPLEAGQTTRTVPAGLWRALHLRDRGCIATGCDAPAIWCEVMHLETPHRLGGRLSIDTAALGCREHHRKLDLHGWQITWRHRRPVLHHPDRPPTTLTTRDEPDPSDRAGPGDHADPTHQAAAPHHGADPCHPPAARERPDPDGGPEP